jgi:oxygen-independent coproporphyrinogen-3 oxidase
VTTPYQGYVYAYPHKTAYRPLDPRPALREVWAGEDRSALFLYLHVPFCEMRCGFCNLFTRAGAAQELTSAYLGALGRQARAVAEGIGPASFAGAAFGGGTPTYLTAAELDALCDVASRFADLTTIPVSVEASPATATADRLAVLKDRGCTRLSMGVQSFLDAEAHAAGRPQERAEVEGALDRIRLAGFDTLNIDLIYGIAGQTPRTWQHSLDAALAWAPEEIYLYPLYTRPLTGLGRRRPGDRDGDQRMSLYRQGRDHLLAAGYEQVSMRMFRQGGAAGTGAAGTGTAGTGTRYCCQEDGMVGLGCGARSYTAALHYSFEYAVGIGHVRRIIDAYIATADFGAAAVGFTLDDGERRRRHLIQSLLQAEGVDRAAYRTRFGTDPLGDFASELARFEAAGWASADADRIRLTAEGLAWSDAIGPALFSARVRALMDAYEAR